MSSVIIAGNTSGTITLDAPAVAGTTTLTLPTTTDTLIGRTTTDTLTNKSLTNPTFNSAELATVSGTAPLYMCRAWVNFNGTGTVAIRASGNVSSITDNGTGIFTVNFTNNMPDINYAAISGFQTPAWPAVTHQYVYAVGSVKVECGAGVTPTYYDPSIFTVAVFR